MAPNHMMCIPRSILLDQDIKGSAYYSLAVTSAPAGLGVPFGGLAGEGGRTPRPAFIDRNSPTLRRVLRFVASLPMRAPCPPQERLGSSRLPAFQCVRST